MTLVNTANTITFQGNGATTQFSYSFWIPASTNAQVVLDDGATQTTLSSSQYELSVSTSGGILTYPLTGSPLASGSKLILTRATPLLQSTVFSTNGTLSTTALALQLDEIVAMIQDSRRQIGESLRVNDANAAIGPLGDKYTRASSYIFFDSSGTPTLVSGTGITIDGVTLAFNTSGEVAINGATAAPGSAGGVVVTDSNNRISAQTVLPTGASTASSLAALFAGDGTTLKINSSGLLAINGASAAAGATGGVALYSQLTAETTRAEAAEAKKITAAGGDASAAVALATGGAGTAPSLATRFAESLDVAADYGASLQDAFTAAQTLGTNVEIVLPAGDYTLSAVASFTGAASQHIAIRGAGNGATRLLATSAGAVSVALGSGASLTVKDLSIIQNGTGNGGTGLAVTSATTNNGPVTLENVTIGFNGSVNGSFATGCSLSNISGLSASDCWFQAYGTTSTLFQINGASAFPAINSKFVNCFFWNGATGILAGDGTNSYVQGVSVANCIFVGPATCIKWYQGSGTIADSLIVTGCQLGGSGTAQIDVSSVLHLQVTGNYFLDGAPGLKVANPADGTVAGNCFFANGQALDGIAASGTQGPGALNIAGNTFFGFNQSGYYPVTLGSGTTGNLVTANLFNTCSEFISDSGTNNITEYAQPGNAVVHNAYHDFKAGLGVGATISVPGININGSANNIGINGSGAGVAPGIQAFGSDTNINLELIPKGTGAVKLTGPLQLSNAYVSGTVPTATGYITLQDSSGTTYYVPVGTAA